MKGGGATLYPFFQGNARFPRFKAKRHRQSATYTKRGFSAKDAGTPGQPLVTLAKMSAPLKVSRPLPSEPSRVTVIREPDGNYYVSLWRSAPNCCRKPSAALGSTSD